MRRLLLSALPLLASLLLAGCGSTPATSDKVGKVYQRESFAAEETFSRLFDANVDAILVPLKSISAMPHFQN